MTIMMDAAALSHAFAALPRTPVRVEAIPDGAWLGGNMPEPVVARASGPMVAPFARALSLLAAFTPQDQWLGTRELAVRTDLPASTVTRIAHSLVLLGYLRHSPSHRGYRLAAPVLALGYGATSAHVQGTARSRMQPFAEQHKVHVNLSSRDRLDVVVLESCSSLQGPLAPSLNPGMRLGIASSPIGWALLAALPDPERYYLLERVEHRNPRAWPTLRRRSSEAFAQVQQAGFCSSLGQWGCALAVVAAPVRVDGHEPLVVGCVDSSGQLTRARVERELGPRLLALTAAIQQNVASQ
jgi:DNA-binding IclR family transcriptional regulator